MPCCERSVPRPRERVDAFLFWDIDGTLLTTARAGIFAWEDAVREVTGRSVSLHTMHTAGLTDVEIAQQILADLREPPDRDTVRQLLRRYEALLPLKLPLRTGHVLAGVREILEHLGRHSAIRSMLLTGNTEAAARAKLVYYGLASFFDGGAFAEDGDSRAAIARRALVLAQERFGEVAGDRVYVIGDTPHDIACGQAIRVRTIAVATGLYTRDLLAEHHPWLILGQLPPPGEFLSRVLSL